jgi:formate hydrogenlyase subunit 6/NADH:ubiquinone oxidoreductase subunit I
MNNTTTTIYYFTATGNSLQIARQLQTQLKNTQLKPMTNQPPTQPIGGPQQDIGFVFPVYFFGMPRIVKRFIQKLTIASETYCFAVINHGGGPFDALGMLNDTLKKRGAYLSYTDQIMMPGNYIVRYGSETLEDAEAIRKNAQQTVTQTAQAISNHTIKPFERNHKLLSKAANKIIYFNVKGFDKKFYSTSDCVGCGLCSEICPVNNIKLEDHHPVWQHNCERCMACIHWCPTEAIQYGKNTVNRSRYHNPNFTAKDIVESN